MVEDFEFLVLQTQAQEKSIFLGFIISDFENSEQNSD